MTLYTKHEIQDSLNHLEDKLCELEQYRTGVSVHCIYDHDLEVLKSSLDSLEFPESGKRKEKLSQFQSEYIRILKQEDVSNLNTQEKLNEYCEEIYDGANPKNDSWHIRNVLIPILVQVYGGNTIALAHILTELLLPDSRYSNQKTYSTKEYLQNLFAQWITTDYLYPKEEEGN